MPYTVRFRPEAEADLEKLVKADAALAQRILSKIKWLADHCTVINHLPLSGNLAGLCKKPVGDYRVIYIVHTNDQTIEICFIGHRKDIYKQA